MDVSTAVKVGREKHPRGDQEPVQYGTAGFRTRAEGLDHVMYRMGLLAVLRSECKQGAVVGLMITASHNPAPDNGVKLVDPRGEMLEQSWEALATRLANVPDEELGAELEKVAGEVGLRWGGVGRVHVGRDTRPSSEALARAAEDGVAALGGHVRDWGVLTTPMLHYFVFCSNAGLEASEHAYFSKLATAFKKLRGTSPQRDRYVPSIMFDGANGVGAVKMKQLLPYLGDSLAVTLCNAGDGQLNHLCGADHVKMKQCAPAGLPGIAANMRCVSVDGDADRVVYYYTTACGCFRLLDGDRIASLVAGYIQELLRASGLRLHLGVVQTAYANGNSTRYITETLGVPVACVATGVKHLHHKALEFDVGVYFEANGHGTIVFSDAAMKTIASAQDQRLRDLMDLINQTVGDALSDMLVVETILHSRGWSIEDWQATYTDLPNRQKKVVVKDRCVVQTTDAERQCTAPAGLQEKINQLVSGFPSGRSFVRPSGTEDIVRVYAEADTQDNADRLATLVAQAVYELAGGVGELP